MNKNQIEREFGSAKELVEECLKEDERARNNDLWLQLMIWQKKQNIKVFIPYDKMKDMINPETIRRVRQRIQNTEGKYLPTHPAVLVKRRIRESLIREYFANNIKLINWYTRLKYKVK